MKLDSQLPLSSRSCWMFASAIVLLAGLLIGLGVKGASGMPEGSLALADIQLAAGSGSTCALVEGQVRCWGYGPALGYGSASDQPVPVAVSGLPAGILQVAASGQHACALTGSGGVKCWGSNTNGQLGDNSNTDRLAPVDVSGLGSSIASLGLGFTHSCAVTNTGGVKCWGLNANGQIGANAGSSSYVPVDVSGLPVVRKVVGGGAHTCALLENGAVRCWGYNFYGQLGNSAAGADSPTPVAVTGLSSGVLDIAAGYVSTCALLETGQVKCWGLLEDIWTDQPVDAPGLSGSLTAVSMGADHVCALDSLGGVKCLGNNLYGQLGDGTTSNRSTAVPVIGMNAGVSALAAGHQHTCAVQSGILRCWGNDGYGQTGAGTTTSSNAPWIVPNLAGQTIASTSNSSLYTCAVTGAGAAYCWGYNTIGELGNPALGSQGYSLPQPVEGIASGATQISAGTHTCAVVNGAARCWGRNDMGQLGTGDRISTSAPAAVVSLTSGVTRISVTKTADQAHTCAIANGGAWCWGGNFVGQLGNGQVDVINGVPSPVAVTNLASGVTDISAGGNHSCAVVNGAAKCWGWGYYGQLGNGVINTNDKYPVAVNVNGLGSGVTAIVAGGDFSCAVVNGAAMCWGRNNAGQLGNGGGQNLASPVQVSGLTSGVTAISAGADRACAIQNGEVWCWGGGAQGSTTPLRIGPISNASQVSAELASCLVRPSGLACWGSDSYGQLGDGRLFNRPSPVDVLGFGPQPELRLSASRAAPGSPVRLVGANWPANWPALVKANGVTIGSLQADNHGFLAAVLITSGSPDGYYDLSLLARGSEAHAGLSLDSAAPVLDPQGGGKTLQLTASLPEPTPVPTPTPEPGVAPDASSIDRVIPAQGDTSLPAQIEVYGANFQDGAVVRLGNIPAIRTGFIDSTHVSAMLPGGLAAGTYDIHVINPDWSKATLAGAYTAMLVIPTPGVPQVQDDLFSYSYELSTGNTYESVGQPVQISFSLHRLGGQSNLTNVAVRFYVGIAGLADPATQATYIGEKVIPTLLPNQTIGMLANWTPAQEGYYELYAVLDPANDVVELNENNNLYRQWVEVRPYVPEDSIAPVVDSVSAPLTIYSDYVEIQVSAHDAGGSKVKWAYLVVWEYFVSSGDWLVTDESGWYSFTDGVTNIYSYSMGYFSGPRFIDVWVADAQDNVSEQPGSVLINYVKPDNFLFSGESHLFLYPLNSGEILSASLTNLYPSDDADLYLWPPDYPSRPTWASENPAGLPESIAIVAPLSGYYWLEAFGYDYAFYNLTASPGTFTEAQDALAPQDKPAHTRQLAGAGDLPGHIIRLAPIQRWVYLPLVQRR